VELLNKGVTRRADPHERKKPGKREMGNGKQTSNEKKVQHEGGKDPRCKLTRRGWSKTKRPKPPQSAEQKKKGGTPFGGRKM